jgi:PAS domain S-box-containing protein
VVGKVIRGEDAVKKAEELHPDLILMDISLKGEMDGIDAALQIRKKFDLPVIFLTAFSNQSTIDRARLAEPFGYILKPFEERELVITVEMALYKHKMERQLRESENKFRGVFEHSSDGIILADRDGNLVKWNTAAEQITGLNRSDVIGRPIWDVIFQLLPQEQRTTDVYETMTDQWNAVVKNGYTSGLDQMTEMEIETPAGERRIIQSNGFTVESGKDSLAGAILRNITAQKRAEQELLESTKRLKVITENAPSIIVEADEDGRILYMSRVLPGYQIQDVLGKNVRDWVEPEYQAPLMQFMKRAISECQVQSLETLGPGENGELRWYLTRLAPVEDANLTKT